MFLASAKLRGRCQVEGQCQAFQGPVPIVVWALGLEPYPLSRPVRRWRKGPSLAFLFLGPDAA